MVVLLDGDGHRGLTRNGLLSKDHNLIVPLEGRQWRAVMKGKKKKRKGRVHDDEDEGIFSFLTGKGNASPLPPLPPYKFPFYIFNGGICARRVPCTQQRVPHPLSTRPLSSYVQISPYLHCPSSFFLSPNSVIHSFISSRSLKLPLTFEDRKMEVPVIDLSPYLEISPALSSSRPEEVGDQLGASLMGLCGEVSRILRETGALMVKDPRCSALDNDRFIDMMEKYFDAPPHFKRFQERPHSHYQVHPPSSPSLLLRLPLLTVREKEKK